MTSSEVRNLIGRLSSQVVKSRFENLATPPNRMQTSKLSYIEHHLNQSKSIQSNPISIQSKVDQSKSNLKMKPYANYEIEIKPLLNNL